MWVLMHPVHIPVHPLNYSFNVHQVLAVNSMYALFSCLVFTIHCHVHVHVVCACTSDSLVIQLLACKILTNYANYVKKIKFLYVLSLVCVALMSILL